MKYIGTGKWILKFKYLNYKSAKAIFSWSAEASLLCDYSSTSLCVQGRPACAQTRALPLGGRGTDRPSGQGHKDRKGSYFDSIHCTIHGKVGWMKMGSRWIVASPSMPLSVIGSCSCFAMLNNSLDSGYLPTYIR